MNASVLGGMLVLCGVLAACSSSSAGSESTGSGDAGGSDGGSSGNGKGGDDDGSGGNGTPAANSSNGSGSGTVNPVTNSSVSAGQTTSTGGGGEGICGTPVYFDEGGPVDTCVEGSCCGELTACVAADGSTAEACNTCLTDGGGPLCDAFLTCTTNAACFGEPGGGVCDSGIAIPDDPEANACLGDACCDEANACTANGADPDSCIACLQTEGGGPLCNAFIACANDSGC